MPRMTGGEAVVRALAAEGVEVVFGLPGVQIMHIYDAFYNNPDIRVISCRHEQTTAYMADGYARSTGKVGVALVVPGPRRLQRRGRHVRRLRCVVTGAADIGSDREQRDRQGLRAAP